MFKSAASSTSTSGSGSTSINDQIEILQSNLAAVRLLAGENKEKPREDLTVLLNIKECKNLVAADTIGEFL